MGKGESLEGDGIHQQQNDIENQICSDFCSFCVKKNVNFKCVFVLVFGLAALVSGIFLILPFVSQKSGFDAKEAIKLSASVQASFRLQMPVSDLVPYIELLEYDINEEIGVPNTKVAILSMHKSWNAPNSTTVIFGVLSDPMNARINPVSLTVLRSSLIELFLQQTNLTLTTSIFGRPSTYEILKCPGGITVNPTIYTSIWQKPQTMFNFTLYDTMSDIQANFTQFKDELKMGLHLKSYEDIYVQITNNIGSTIASPVIVEASVVSDMGNLQPQRLKQLAQTLKGSPSKNLGISHSIFGTVKAVRLSSFMEDTLDSDPPISSPSPSPGPADPPHPAQSPAPSPDIAPVPPCSNCEAFPPSYHRYPLPPSAGNGQYDSPPPLPNSPGPSVTVADPPDPCPDHDYVIPPNPSPTPPSDTMTPASPPHSQGTGSPSVGLTPHSSPELSPIPVVSYGSNPHRKESSTKGPSSALSSSIPIPSTSAPSPFYKDTWLFCFAVSLVFHLLCSL